MTSTPRTPAQAAQQDNRDSLGRYQRKANQAADASVDLEGGAGPHGCRPEAEQALAWLSTQADPDSFDLGSPEVRHVFGGLEQHVPAFAGRSHVDHEGDSRGFLAGAITRDGIIVDRFVEWDDVDEDTGPDAVVALAERAMAEHDLALGMVRAHEAAIGPAPTPDPADAATNSPDQPGQPTWPRTGSDWGELDYRSALEQAGRAWQHGDVDALDTFCRHDASHVFDNGDDHQEAARQLFTWLQDIDPSLSAEVDVDEDLESSGFMVGTHLGRANWVASSFVPWHEVPERPDGSFDSAAVLALVRREKTRTDRAARNIG